MSTDDTQDIMLQAQCLCKGFTFTAQITRQNLPLEGSMCHCTSCRNVTGAMYSSDTNWPGPRDEVLNSNLKRYEFTANVTVMFCGTCSAPMFWDEHYQNKANHLSVFTGVLKDVDDGNLIRFVDQIFVGDTEDGGISPWLQDVNHNGPKPRIWEGRSGKSNELHEDLLAAKGNVPSEKVAKTGIPMHCRCKGVQLVFRPGNVNFSTMDPKDIPGYIDRASHKHLATLDPCNSCRLSIGVDMMNWTFALPAQIEFAEASEGNKFPQNTHELKSAVQSQERDPRYGTLTFYASSPDVQRYFCSRCSATVFYTVDDRPDVIDVAVGLLHAPEGARAESVLAWNLGAQMMSEKEFGDTWRGNLVKSVKAGSEKWRTKKGYEKTWFRVNGEEAQNKA
ncbi:uncharacterized protein FIESC28_03472 [Fusarium coffeatum]|uniref:CENP-V/GFA domain-containing protein n=1 Tax=Fusarium coffeatum TaxID=231269 RepID=A0A366S4R7_9HYPO|nr:uncharacterized protein FIESC28_03472 [Fusarium coffeatum]RBR23676.1 hypothetical protein FIESC28_03472 [Fusarium coffeatum]